jgi:proton-dependent oligopeptide transporter, POT family
LNRGLGLQTASALVLLLWFLAYVSPVFGAWIADTTLGRFRAIVLGVVIAAIAHIIMVASAVPSVIAAGNALPPFIISLILLAVGTGIFKANVSSAVVDQYSYQREYTKVLKSGEKVLVDPETTVQRLMLIFYTLVNIGAIYGIASAYIEKYRGFWQAFLVPAVMYLGIPIVLGFFSKKIVKKPPRSSEMSQFFKITGAALRENKFNIFSPGFWDKVKTSAPTGQQADVTWSDKNVRDVQRAWQAFQIFLYFPLFLLTHNGVGAIRTNQGASMVSNGVPNDLLGNFNALTIVWFAPLMSHVIYPLLNKHNIEFKRINRMTLGFLLCVVSGVVGGIVQHYVYQLSPCGYGASKCHAPAPISIWVQLPNLILGGMSEVFCAVTALEMAYARAPPNMKSTVTSMFLFMYALNAALGQLLLPAVMDPTLVVGLSSSQRYWFHDAKSISLSGPGLRQPSLSRCRRSFSGSVTAISTMTNS